MYQNCGRTAEVSKLWENSRCIKTMGEQPMYQNYGRTAEVSKLWENSRCIKTVRHCVHFAKGKKEKDNLHITCFHKLQELEPT